MQGQDMVQRGIGEDMRIKQIVDNEEQIRVSQCVLIVVKGFQIGEVFGYMLDGECLSVVVGMVEIFDNDGYDVEDRVMKGMQSWCDQ